MIIRVNNIEFRKYTSSKTKKPLYEIIKWIPNSCYGKEKEYRKNGYVDSFGGDFLKKGCRSIQKSIFKNPESCYVLAFIEKGSESWELRSVGERMLDLTHQEWLDFHQVYKKGQAKLNRKNDRNRNNNI
jgi:hypothetical protein